MNPTVQGFAPQPSGPGSQVNEVQNGWRWTGNPNSERNGWAPPAGYTDAAGTTGTASLNLPDLYNSLSKSAGISDIEKSLTDKQSAFNDAQSKINDNPFLSEGNRVGRVSKLQTDYNNDIKSVQDNLAMKKQDIQTQIDLQTKQFDINSQTAAAAREQFNTLLSSGALAGASGSDIAAITAQTGISSGEIQAAISAQADKNVSTSVQTVDDGTNIYSVVLNNKTGEVIKKNVLSASKPVKGAAGPDAYTQLVEQNKIDTLQAPQVLRTGAAIGKTLDDMMAYGQSLGVDKNTVYNIYAATNYYKPNAAQKKADKARYGIK